ncbi:MAG: DNA mismatch repair endonuclease MutL [Bacteroidales bacterium]|nr:DNA mismatch repair endonuclease MutL [Bacteroidales bacterium]
MDIIHILPDAVANQIAAGEVIQRPASLVKELMENAVDAGADDITLIIKDSGKSLVQVIDNGCGMSETDARLCFERHATSKINKSDDLGRIKTFGFRGEALASIAAIAQVEIKTKKVENELGTRTIIDGSELKVHEVCSTQNGTSISVKNLFFNVPARRKFLKSNTAEMRHIVEEFNRLALINSQIAFTLYNNNKILYKLPEGNFKQRIVAIFGAEYGKRLLLVDEDTSEVKVYGYIGKPEFAKKTRGEQYFFTNKRFIKHPYLNHSVENAFEELIPADAHPTYFLSIEIDPEQIDINIHPTKTEINFQNSQLIYTLIKSAVKKALGQFSFNSMDFNKDRALEFDTGNTNRPIIPPGIKVNPDYNPFETKSAHIPTKKKNIEGWENLYEENTGKAEITQSRKQNAPEIDEFVPAEKTDTIETLYEEAFQLNNIFIITKIKSGIVIIDQQRAHQRILYEKYLKFLEESKQISQQQLFPVNITLSPNDSAILEEILQEVKIIGFDIENFGKNTYIIHGTPADLNNEDIKGVLEKIINNYKLNKAELNSDLKINLARSVATNLAVKHGIKLEAAELRSIINRLFACRYPSVSPNGKPVFTVLSLEELLHKFKQGSL